MLSNFGSCCMQKEKIITNFPLGEGDQGRKHCQFDYVAETSYLN